MPVTGTLPAGVTLNPTTGVLSGAPQGTGTFSFVIRVTDNARATGTKSFSLTVGASTPAQITANALDFFAPAGAVRYSEGAFEGRIGYLGQL